MLMDRSASSGGETIALIEHLRQESQTRHD
jgi:hypothetical protein